MSLKTWGWVYGVVFVVIGVLGFVPGAVTPDGMLLGIFSVDTMHSIIHLLTGVLAIAAVWGTGMYARMYFKVFGVIYALVTVVGFVQGDTVLGLMMVNTADNVLHFVVALVALWLGFGTKEAAAPMAAM
jgi:hypothetical protein